MLTWKPDRCVTSDEVRLHFQALGAKGDPESLKSWLMKDGVEGRYASIPEDEPGYTIANGRLLVPLAMLIDGHMQTDLMKSGNYWSADWCFAAFI